ncbi:uncharacterized protein [Rutidosis leptorrhynchoides]|uniref:uncharacterized protein n=1 Tax=Rutidosis leptorrhynchoides TaxID=125765 RepID=UPI003A99DFE2
MIPITSPWPFCKWAIDIVGPFPVGTRNADYLVVVIDFFTKWVEAKPLNKITSKKVRDFIWESIVCRIGIPNEIVSDNGTQFEWNLFNSWCIGMNVKQGFTSVAHPQANEQCEMEWMEIAVPTEQVLSFNLDQNSKDLHTNLELLEERREMAAVREAINKQRIARYYDKKVRMITYVVGDLVWHDNQASRIEDTGKLGPNWEGPYKVVRISKTRTYRLAELNGRAVKRTWHATTLKRCYM